jgi:hypothetical protein
MGLSYFEFGMMNTEYGQDSLILGNCLPCHGEGDSPKPSPRSNAGMASLPAVARNDRLSSDDSQLLT